MITRCSKCGNSNPTTSTFCAYCGLNLGPANSPGAAQGVVTQQVAKKISGRGLVIGIMGGLLAGIALAGAVLIFALSKPPTGDGGSSGGVVITVPPITIATTTPPPTTTIAITVHPTTTASATTIDPTTTAGATTTAITVVPSTTIEPTTAVITTAPPSTRVITMATATTAARPNSAPGVGVSTVPGLANKLIFMRPDGNNRWNIYSVTTDGSNEQLLVTRQYDVVHPALSPDGQWLAYVLDPDMPNLRFRQIRKVRLDGTEDTPLTDTANRNDYPAWSPDGNQLYFRSNRNYPDREDRTDIWVMNSDGSNPQMRYPGGSIINVSQSFLVFSKPVSAGKIKLMADYGSGERDLVPDNQNEFPVISPDGNQIAFTVGARVKERCSDNRAVYVMNRDGSGKRQISPGGVVAANPSWSPDGRFLAYLVLSGTTGSCEDLWQVRILDIATGKIVSSFGQDKKFNLSWGR